MTVELNDKIEKIRSISKKMNENTEKRQRLKSELEILHSEYENMSTLRRSLMQEIEKDLYDV